MGLQELQTEFLHPSEEFSPMPFWFWNDELTEAEIDRQMTAFKEKGVDGFVIHPRMGLPESIGYLSERYFHYVKYAVKRAQELDMKVILYDEAMYPSGSCHGEVVRENPAYASRGLAMRTDGALGEGERLVAQCVREETTYYFIETFTGGTIRGVHYGEDDGEPNAPKSADLLNYAAVASFIRLTHERYYQHLKEYFGSTVIAMFTDEPGVSGRCSKGGLLAWTDGFLSDFLAEGGVESDLYELFAGADDDRTQRAWHAYRRALHKRLSASYYGQIADWCASHGIAMTGHPEQSTDIGYLSLFDIPCQDVVWRYVAPGEASALTGGHSTMAKCASDSARHRGKRRNGNECFGCCGAPDDPYRFTREDMKWYLDWLFARGCNLIIPHAFYYSLRGKRREERPPEVGMHSAFWEEYRTVTDYIKRMCALNTDSVNDARAAILCGEDDLSWRAAKPLYENQIEFNYLEESLLSGIRIEDGQAMLGSQHYRVLIADGRASEEGETFLAAFAASGGTVIRYDGTDDAVYADEVRAACGRMVRTDAFVPSLRITRLTKRAVDFLLLTNEGEQEIRTTLSVPDGRVMQVWDAWEGTVAEPDPADGGYPLVLGRRESVILVLEQEKNTNR